MFTPKTYSSDTHVTAMEDIYQTTDVSTRDHKNVGKELTK
jgi:hypothetical protein